MLQLAARFFVVGQTIGRQLLEQEATGAQAVGAQPEPRGSCSEVAK